MTTNRTAFACITRCAPYAPITLGVIATGRLDACWHLTSTRFRKRCGTHGVRLRRHDRVWAGALVSQSTRLRRGLARVVPHFCAYG